MSYIILVIKVELDHVERVTLDVVYMEIMCL